jgi:hypothetical protein
MRWLDLLFLHWTVTPSVLRPHVPGRLTIDTFESSAWLGVVPFLMSGVRPRFALRGGARPSPARSRAKSARPTVTMCQPGHPLVERVHIEAME